MEIQSVGKKKMVLDYILTVAETDEGEEYDGNLSLDHSSIVYNFPEGKYIVTIEAITNEVLGFRKENR